MRPNPKPIKKEKTKFGKRMCKNCKERFEKLKPLQFTCSVPCAIAYSKKEQEKKEAKDWRVKKKKGLDKIKSISEWKGELQVQINWIVREIDKNLPCISHPKMEGFLRYDAGHAFTVAAHGDIRYNLHNIHKQNSQANERYGYCVEYQVGLRERYGMEYLKMLESLPLKYKGTAKDKFTIHDIRDTYLPRAKAIVKRMKKGETFTRDEVNQEIGIYK